MFTVVNGGTPWQFDVHFVADRGSMSLGRVTLLRTSNQTRSRCVVHACVTLPGRGLWRDMDTNALRRARLAACLTQEQLARRAGVTVGLVRAWEGGAVVAPRLDRALAVARALGIDVADLADPGRAGDA